MVILTGQDVIKLLPETEIKYFKKAGFSSDEVIDSVGNDIQDLNVYVDETVFNNCIAEFSIVEGACKANLTQHTHTDAIKSLQELH